MVTITGYKKIQKENAESFCVLILQGGVEVVNSQKTGKPYMTAKKANMVSTFDEETCKALVGGKLPGSIIKQQCVPYQYQIPGTDEVVEMNHTYVYSQEATSVEETIFQPEKVA